MRIRNATPRDWHRIVEIYNQAIATGISTADTTPVSVRSRRSWLGQHSAEKYPIFVAEEEDRIIGWCSLSPYRPGRMALRHTAEISYYIAEERQRMGVASRLIAHALGECRRLEIRSVFAILLDVNWPSRRLLERLGFDQWGHLPNIADFDGRQCGQWIFGKRVY